MDANVFVQNVKKYCAIKGVAPTVACRESGAGKSLMSQVAQGIVPSVSKVQLLAQYLGVTTSDLLGEAQKSSPPSEEDGLLTDYKALTARNQEKAREYLALLLAFQDKP